MTQDNGGPALSLVRHAFAADVLDALRGAPGVKSAEYVADAFAIELSIEGGPDGRWQLDSLFRQSLSDAPDQRRARVLAALEAFRAHPAVTDWEAASRALVPVIRKASYLRSSEGAFALTWELCADLGMAFALPRRGAIQYVTEELATSWGRTADDVFDAGLTGHARRAENVSLSDEDGKQTLVGVDAGDDNASALLVIPGFLDVLARELGGPLVAAIPAPPVLLVAPASSKSAVLALRARAKADYEAAATGISPLLFTSGEDGTFVPYSS